MQTIPVYKTAKQLGIREDERAALVELIGPLSRSELQFDMTRCTLCAGGHVADILGLDESKYVNELHSEALEPLYYPPGPRPDFSLTAAIMRMLRGEKFILPMSGWSASPEQGAKAIVNFLTLGYPEWDFVMAGRSALQLELAA